MTEETHEKLKAIKQSFRSMMNGPVSQSMREKGSDYKINWGVALPLLQKMAAEYGYDYDLAINLWKEEQTHTQEMAEIAASKLYQYLPFASVMAYEWIATDKVYYQIAAYNILGRLFARGMAPNELGINEFLDQVAVALQDDNIGVRHAAYNCLTRFEDLGDDYALLAQKAMRSQGLHL